MVSRKIFMLNSFNSTCYCDLRVLAVLYVLCVLIRAPRAHGIYKGTMERAWYS